MYTLCMCSEIRRKVGHELSANSYQRKMYLKITRGMNALIVEAGKFS